MVNSNLAEQYRLELTGSGIDHLLWEYDATSDPARRERLAKFFNLCIEPSHCTDATDRVVRLANHEDLVAAGRADPLLPGSSQTLRVLGKDVPDPTTFVFDVSDGLLLSDQTVMVDGLYLTDLIRHMSGNWLVSGEGFDLPYLRVIDLPNRAAIIRLPDNYEVLSDNYKYFMFQSIVGSLSFGHFIIDMMMQLAAFCHMKLLHGDALKPLIINEAPWIFKWPGMEWLFTHLVGPLSDVVHVHGRSVWLPGAYTTNRLIHLGEGGFSLASFRFLRERMAELLSPSLGSRSPRYIYVSRKDAGYREADNIDEVEVLLGACGFSTIVIQDLTPQEAYDTFHQTEIIVGMHGSGLMYNVYTRGPATVIELAYPGYEWDVILACAAACGHTAIRVGREGGRVDLAALRRTLESLSVAMA